MSLPKHWEKSLTFTNYRKDEQNLPVELWEKGSLRGQVLIFENTQTIVRKRSDLDSQILQFWNDSKEESSLPRKRSC